jgi:hypothetical protein
MRFLALASGLAGALLATAAFAQPRLQRGTYELSVHVDPDFEGVVGDMIDVRAGFGRFLRDALALRGTVRWEVIEDVAGEDADYRGSELVLAGEWHFDRGRWVPYLGAGLGGRRVHFGDRAVSGLVYGPRGGLKLFLADNVALDLEVTCSFGSADVFVNDFVLEDNDLATGIGLRVLF